MSSVKTICPSCQSEVDRAELVNGLCPFCLLSDGIMDPTMKIKCHTCGHVNIVSYHENESFSCKGCQTLVQFDRVEEGGIEFAETKHGGSAEWLGRYKLIRLLGEGKFGSVWLANDVALNRLVAIKKPLLEDLSRSDQKRIAREAEAASRLNHPNIVRTLDILTLGNNVHIISDYISGANLQMTLQQRLLTIQESVFLISKLANAIDYTHSMGIVHRDLKPANILIETQKQKGERDQKSLISQRSDLQPYITDFGMSIIEGHYSNLNTDRTVVGTPAYMSPEQIDDPESVDYRTDIYSLGVIFYELLCCKLPYIPKMEQGKVTIGEILPPDHANKSIPKDLSAICMKCLANEKRMRYNSAHDLMMDLEFWMAGLPVKARELNLYERLTKWGKRKPIELSLTLVIFFIMFFTILFIYNDWKKDKLNLAETERQRILAEENFELAKSSLDQSYNINKKTLLESEHIVPVLEQGQKKLIEFYKKLITKKSTPDLLEDYAERCFEFAEYMYNYHDDGSSMKDVIYHYDKAISLMEGLMNDFPDDLQYKLKWMIYKASMGEYHSWKEENDKASLIYIELSNIIEKESQKKQEEIYYETLHSFYVNAGCHYKSNQDLDLSERFLKKQIEVSNYLIDKNMTLFQANIALAHAYRDLAQVYEYRGDLNKVEEYYINSLEWKIDSSKLDEFDLIEQAHSKSMGYNQLAKLYNKQNKFEQSQKYDRMAIELSKQILNKFPDNEYFRNYLKRLSEKIKRKNKRNEIQ